MEITRKIDDAGRIAIPKEVRKNLLWYGGDEISITLLKGNRLLLQKKSDDVLDGLRQQVKMLVSPDKAEKILKILDENT